MHRVANRSGITLVEIVFYGILLFGLYATAYVGVAQFNAWNCRKHMNQMANALEESMTSGMSTRPETIEELAPNMKKVMVGGKLPHCGSVPPDVNYVFDPLDGRFRCTYHGLY